MALYSQSNTNINVVSLCECSHRFVDVLVCPQNPRVPFSQIVFNLPSRPMWVPTTAFTISVLTDVLMADEIKREKMKSSYVLTLLLASEDSFHKIYRIGKGPKKRGNPN